ncbi:hypothetical protein SLNWT_3540 [Streptomyces albus]|uniref:DUF397 domain-containing protein n=1 Tax=Streptomyces albus (strain ATCC 21838 / DSM 41398 / FERM P-419 / JCM 4703 / NBRC 107858) TaxID=1081613 RepID=A0A0B5EZ67_STRA4|nr:hypothetical protein SLNWT_3540 [Streptomyces albus]AOU78220.1 hypothetical protein SLNHY_3529 [Streptomyces albus]AYN33973.1 DUF397 domain-containing protein [Streptomyces albus]
MAETAARLEGYSGRAAGFRSDRADPQGVAATPPFDFATSGYSGGGGACVDVAANVPGVIAVRDSEQTDSPVLRFTPASRSALLGELRVDGS